MNKILITGAAGFVGFNLSLHLQRLGFEVVMLDIADRMERIDYFNDAASHEHNAPLHLLQADLTKGLQAIPDDIDAIIHLAALPHVDYSYYYPEFVHYNNVQSTAMLLKYATQHEIPLLFGSSVEVYGGEDAKPYVESDPYNPMSPYAASKVACEFMVKTYAKCFGLQAKTFRLTNLYGPWQAPDRIIPRNISRLIDDVELDIQSEVTRDFLYIDDALRAITSILERGQFGQVYNISSGIGTQMTDIKERFIAIAGEQHIRSRLRTREITKTRGASLLINSDKLQTQLGWSPTISLNDGLDRTLKWYADHNLWSSKFRQHYMSERTGKSFMVDYTHGFLPPEWSDQEVKPTLSGIGS